MADAYYPSGGVSSEYTRRGHYDAFQGWYFKDLISEEGIRYRRTSVEQAHDILMYLTEHRDRDQIVKTNLMDCCAIPYIPISKILSRLLAEGLITRTPLYVGFKPRVQGTKKNIVYDYEITQSGYDWMMQIQSLLRSWCVGLGKYDSSRRRK